jgi:hypothetical protein
VQLLDAACDAAPAEQVCGLEEGSSPATAGRVLAKVAEEGGDSVPSASPSKEEISPMSLHPQPAGDSKLFDAFCTLLLSSLMDESSALVRPGLLAAGGPAAAGFICTPGQFAVAMCVYHWSLSSGPGCTVCGSRFRVSQFRLQATGFLLSGQDYEEVNYADLIPRPPPERLL